MKIKLSFMAALLIGCQSPSLSAQEPAPTLTLSQAIKRGLSHPDLEAYVNGRSALAESEVMKQRTWDNPQIFLSREDIDQTGIKTNETYFLVSQRVDLLGIRSLRTRAAKHKKQAVHWENQNQERDREALLRERFFDVLYFQKRIEVWQDWQVNIDQIAQIVAKRERAGQVSGYDRRRVARELSEARVMTARDRAFHEGKWEQLAALVALDDLHTLSATLLPPAGEFELSLTTNPRFRAFDEEIEAVSLEEKAARKWMFREVTFEAGLKETRIGGEKETGLFLSVKVPVPVFDRNKSSQMRAQAKGKIAGAEKALALAETQGRLNSLKRQIRLNRAMIHQFRTETIGSSRELVAIAEAAYSAGEMEILTLIEAYRSLRDASLKVLSFEAETRFLFIELGRLGGGQ